jgi:hypothetical protein
VRKTSSIVVLAMLLTSVGFGSQVATADPNALVKQARLVKAAPGPTPKGKIANYVADVKTGDTRFVGFTDISGVSAAISGPYNPPRASDFSIDPVSTPYAAYGFAGVGTKTGSWLHRIGAQSGSWSGYFYWISGANRFKSVTMQRNAAVLLTGEATFDQVTILS